MQRIYAAIQGTRDPVTWVLHNLPGRDFGYDGIAAFGRDPNNIVLIVAKSQNDNAVLYEYVPGAKPRVEAYWLSIEPSSRAEHMAKGNPSLFDKLNPAEETGYGVAMETVADGKGGARFLVNVRADALADRRMDLLQDEARTPFLGGVVGGKRARVLYAYLQMRRGLTALTAFLPTAIEEIRFYGTDATPGSPTFNQTIVEAIRPS